MKQGALYPENTAYMWAMNENSKWTVCPGQGGKFWVCPRLENGKAGDGFAQFDSLEEAQRAIDSGDVDRDAAVIGDMVRGQRKRR
ncbi:hypothetical protein BSN85_24820 [Bradyrhizobium brasilense]|uniref:hypothetical protein n=1 Tax=Bradyrhizobium brasilense TaxID=1419277 RepID=UPI000975C9DD|nr:hypothetical protein [Bradyrhizobium brasilense]OMI05519.1 hypothetical protein BSN85_24820 [Bradyrhizobium brasilense]